ncbi:MAG: arginase [Culicoidibacterales bacterium]
MNCNNKLMTNLYQGANNEGIKDGYTKLCAKYPQFADIKFIETIQTNRTYPENMKYREDVLDTLKSFAEEAKQILANEGTLLTLGGDHAMGAASVAVANEAIDNLGVIWIDAHADINDEHVTNSGHIHGMPIAFLLGEGDADFVNLTKRTRFLNPENIVLFATRDVEDAEAAAIKRLGIKEFTYEMIEEHGFEAMMQEAINYLQSKTTNLHISYDLDSGKPEMLPGVTTDVVGGLDLEQTKVLIQTLFQTFNVKTMDIVEYNPSRDIEDKTLDFFKELIELVDSEMGMK